MRNKIIERAIISTVEPQKDAMWIDPRKGLKYFNNGKWNTIAGGEASSGSSSQGEAGVTIPQPTADDVGKALVVVENDNNKYILNGLECTYSATQQTVSQDVDIDNLNQYFIEGETLYFQHSTDGVTYSDAIELNVGLSTADKTGLKHPLVYFTDSNSYAIINYYDSIKYKIPNDQQYNYIKLYKPFEKSYSLSYQTINGGSK